MLKIKQPIKGKMRITVKHNAPAWWYIRGKHQGIDIATRNEQYPDGIGMPIYAVADGVWEKASYDTKMGNTVVLRHLNGYKTVYGHLNEMTFKEGYKNIKAGDIIGYSGKTGKICFGAHLHFEIKNNGVSLDPMIFIEAGKNLVNWAKRRPILRVEGNGEMQYLIKGEFVKLEKNNCWNIISKNSTGISKENYKDLLDLLI